VDLGGGAAGSAWNLFRAYQAHGYASWLAVGRKCSTDPDVFLIPDERKRTCWNRPFWIVHDRLEPLVGRIRGAGRLRTWLRILANPRRELERQLGIEDFNFLGTYHLLDLSPQRPDLVHCHNLHGYYFDLRVLPWLSRQVPLILNLRDAWLLSGHCAYSLGCERWKSGCGRCPDLAIYPSIKRDATARNWQRKRYIFEKSRLYITTTSQWLMDQVQASMLCGIQYRVIPNAIDLTVFRPTDQTEARKSLNLPADVHIVLLTGQTMFKDYDTMEAALSRLDKSDGVDLMFICLGREGVDKDLGQGRIVFPGFERSPDRMVQYYSAADVFIHAAKDEAFGKTIAEALACRVPVVATAVGGIPEQIEDGRTGFLVPKGDSVAMSAGIKRLLADKDLRCSMGQAGATEVARRFALERQVQAFLEWYKEVVEDWREAQHYALPKFR
jgi:glycosyltransferase involved in cell wall biosynthesis